MIDYAMNEFVGQTDIARQRVRRDFAARFNMLPNDRTQRIALHVGNDFSNDFAAILFVTALENSENASLSITAGILTDFSLADFLVHVAGKAADVAFVNLYLAAQLRERTGLHGEPNAVLHEPC